MLFDIIRELNDEIGSMMTGGNPGRREPCLYGVTNGYEVQITFMDLTVWDSVTWEHEDSNESLEHERIKNHIKKAIEAHLLRLFDIQFDVY